MATENPSTSSTTQPVKASSSSCPHCSPPNSENARNIIVCIDGTSNQFGQNNTNVVKLFSQIDLESVNPKQITYYSSGIGTGPKSLYRMRGISNKIDEAIAWSVEKMVKDAYDWLARTYHEGDQIYLFGFSRGAYQVRVLAEMIHEVGLLRTPTVKQIGIAYDHYKATRCKKSMAKFARQFKRTFSWWGVRAHFVGVWDTVSSVGFVRQNISLSSSSSETHACHFRHALALDEHRVKFMPEYLREINTFPNNPALHRGTESDNVFESYEARAHKAAVIKEVWFAGSHSDVGGTNSPGRLHQAGNVSLLWMRREAAAEGLVLRPTDILWVPDDVCHGTSNPMNFLWRAIEYLPIIQQTSFSGAGKDTLHRHRLEPRRIIPGQKVHASILYANTYRPQATLGEGFDTLIMCAEPEDTTLDDSLWDTGLFEDTEAQVLLNYLDSQQKIAPICLDKLLFMLRFKEGRQRVRNVHDWENRLKCLIKDTHAPLKMLVALIAFYEVGGAEGPHDEFDGKIFQRAIEYLKKIPFKHPDCPRVIALLRPLTKHQTLRERILVEEVLNNLVNLFDHIISSWDDFGQAMDGLNYLLQCKHTQQTFVGKLQECLPGSKYNRSRLYHILQIKDPRLLTAALRMVLTFARIPEAKTAANAQTAGDAHPGWPKVKDRIRCLAKGSDRLLGRLAVEILFALHDAENPGQLDIRNACVRTNIASALKPKEHDSADGQDCDVDREQQMLRQFFGLGAKKLEDKHKKLIEGLTKAVKRGNAGKRTTGTLTLLKLCESKIIRAHFLQIGLLDIFIDQLQHKNTALLAAHALATCLKHDDMKNSEPIKNNDLLPKHILRMLQMNYFDDAVGREEGFQIFKCILTHEDLRKKIKDHGIVEVLNTKLGKVKAKDIRTSLICLENFLSIDGCWADELVRKSLKDLESRVWKTQKAGVLILSALAQTKKGTEAINGSIPNIVKMLLPIKEETSGDHANLYPPTQAETYTGSQSTTLDTSSEPSSWMMGPACALRILAQNERLRQRMHETQEYGELKYLYVTRTLVSLTDTSPWRIMTPNRADVTHMVDKMIQAVDAEISEEGLISIGGAILPHINHWDVFMMWLFRVLVAGIVTVVGFLVLGIIVVFFLALGILGLPVGLVYVLLLLYGNLG